MFGRSKRKCPEEDVSPPEIFFIQIPFSGMLNNEQIIAKYASTSSEDKQNPRRTYKLIDGVPSDTEIRIRKSYVMSYNSRTMNAEWVYEILKREKEGTKKDERDPICSKEMSFGTNPFNNKDYHQGHLAAAANHTWCMEAFHDTYLMSNMVPQLSDLNSGVWITLENHCRNIVKKDNVRNVHVYTGPLYLRPSKKKKNESQSEDDHLYPSDPSREERLGGKVKPTHLFKVIIVENKDGTVKEPECYRMRNTNTEYKKTLKKYKAEMADIHDIFNFLSNYFTHIDVIEAQSGLKFKKRCPNVDMVNSIDLHTITLTGEHTNGELCSATINVNCLFQA
ncbi:hypothetical protein R3I94_001381 [Phoxinus phoxinus]